MLKIETEVFWVQRSHYVPFVTNQSVDIEEDKLIFVLIWYLYQAPSMSIQPKENKQNLSVVIYIYTSVYHKHSYLTDSLFSFE